MLVGMKTLISKIARMLTNGERASIEDLPWPPEARLLVLAPHPDDFDAIGVTLRYFRDLGNEVRLTVISPSWSGVEDSFCPNPSPEEKAALREEEQLQSCALFGIPARHVVFLRLPEDRNGDPVDDDANFSMLSGHLSEIRPQVVFCPHGNDPNPGHFRTFRMLWRHVGLAGFPGLVLLNRDPKTVSMQAHLLKYFGGEEARWKGSLLRCHASQQQRNLHVRGYGFDERIHRVNRQIASEFPGNGPYAEVFEVKIGDVPHVDLF
jgi:LmbE family N-acetylglucosaminyl deacetylase